MTDITIPPEAVEAAVEDIRPLRHNPFITDGQLTRAAIRAAIKAWPGAYIQDGRVSIPMPSVILPLTQEARDENHLRPDRRTNVAERLFGDE